MKKKILKAMTAICISTAMLAGGMTAMAASFTDVNEGDWYFNPIDYVSERGIMTGYESGKFGPGDAVLRGQFATIMYRLEGSPETVYDAIFPDVAEGKFYSLPAVWSNNEGIITGYDNGQFGYADKITREQLVTILYRYSGGKGYDTSDKQHLSEYPDHRSVSSFATAAMEWSTAVGIISGDQGNLNPQGTANRAQAATIIQRFQRYVGADAAHTHVWKDTTETIWIEDVPAYTETVPVYTKERHDKCLECDFDTTDMYEASEHTFWTGHDREIVDMDIQTGTEEIYHEAEGHEETVTHSVCTICDQTK